MSYLDFKKQAGIGDAISWGWDKVKDNIGSLPTLKSVTGIDLNVTPFDSVANSISWQPLRDNGAPVDYRGMDANQKFDTFQQDVRRNANRSVGVLDAAKAVSDDLRDNGFVVFNPMDPMGFGNIRRLYNTAKSVVSGSGLPMNNVNQLRNNALVSPEVQQAADNFIASSDISDINTYQQRIDEMASSLPNTEAAAAFKNYVADGLKSRVWDGIKSNPIKNIPLAVSMFLRQKGMGQFADLVANPIAFYGSLIGILGGGAALLGGLGGGSSQPQQTQVTNYYNKVPYT